MWMSFLLLRNFWKKIFFKLFDIHAQPYNDAQHMDWLPFSFFKFSFYGM